MNFPTVCWHCVDRSRCSVKEQNNTSVLQCWKAAAAAPVLCIPINQQGGSHRTPFEVGPGKCWPGLCSVPCGGDSTDQNMVPHPFSPPNPCQETGYMLQRKDFIRLVVLSRTAWTQTVWEVSKNSEKHREGGCAGKSRVSSKYISEVIQTSS